MRKSFRLLFCGAVLLAPIGCRCVPNAEWNALHARNSALSEQNRAQLAEIENIRQHSRTLEDRLISSEKQLALLEEQSSLDRKQLDSFGREREELYSQFQALASGRGRLPPELNRQLVELSERHSSLQFDPETGVGKLDTDILFDSGEAVLKPGAERLLDDLVRVLRSPAAGELKIMIAGHTDNQLVAGRSVREKYPNNFHLSTARALAVADRMKRAGLPEQRMGVAGFGPCQPVAPNTTARNRQKNRRVEIFVMNAEAPVVGWSESMPSVYGRGVKR